jgi:hypothetical protein
MSFETLPASALRRLAAELPDLPRLVETRGLLLAGRCQLARDEESCVVAATQVPLACVVGAPATALVRAAAERAGGATTVLCASEAARRVGEALPERRLQRARIHVLGAGHGGVPRAEPADGVELRLLTADEADLLRELPDELRTELTLALAQSVVAAAFVDGRPVSFCTAPWVTERWWDVSVDTVAEHRGRGLAARCYERLRIELAATGREPVWGAVEENVASLRLAARLGFVQVDELALFEPR